MVSAGLRIGTPALAARRFDDTAFSEASDVIAAAISGPLADERAAQLRGRVANVADEFPLYLHLTVANGA